MRHHELRVRPPGAICRERRLEFDVLSRQIDPSHALQCRRGDTVAAKVVAALRDANPGHDRVIEVPVIRIVPGRPPRLVLDTLVNPRRRPSEGSRTMAPRFAIGCRDG